MSILQTTQFDIVELSITTSDGVKLDISEIYEEINIFDNVMLPCMSGNIVIKDGVGFSSKINFDGSEYINIKICKDVDTQQPRNDFDKKFVIYKQTDRTQLNQSAELYTLHFVSEEFILSSQKKIRQMYKGTYSDIVRKILQDYLGVKNQFGDIFKIYDTKGIQEVLIPNLSPFDAIEYITKRANSQQGVPDMMFWQNHMGYNFMPLSYIMNPNDSGSIATINFGAKNLSIDNMGDEMFGARDYRIVSQFDAAQNIQSGVYAGKFIGFDTLTRTIKTSELSFNDTYKLSSHANKNSMNTKILNKERKTADQMYDSRITLYPYQLERANTPFLKANDPKTANIVDNSHNYILQRKSIFSNLMQKRIRITMPGNFILTAGSPVTVQMPKRNTVDTTDEFGDITLQGRYMITGARHIIRYDKHETVMEVATDSTNFGVKK
jgi:hypothetical protein